MPARLLVCAVALALLVLVGAKRAKHLPWGVQVYTKIDTTNVRAVSAQTSSYVWEGVITYGWWDDSFVSPYTTDIAYDGTRMSSYAAHLLLDVADPTLSVTMNTALGQCDATSHACTDSNFIQTYTTTTGAAPTSASAATAYATKIVDEANYDWSIGQLSQYYVGATYESSSSSVWPQVVPTVLGSLATSANQISWSLQFDVPDHVGADCPGYAANPSAAGGTLSWNCPAEYYYVDKDPTKPRRIWVVGLQRLSVTVQQPQDLHDFPLDTQTISFNLINSYVPNFDMNFVLTTDTANTASPTNTVDGYKLVSTKTSVGVSGKPNLNSQLQVQFVLKRIPDVFFNRFVLPLVLISSLILTLLFANTAARAMAAFSIIATTTSFVFISSNSVPQLPYRTRLDNFFVFQFMLAFCVGVWNIHSTHNMDRFRDKYMKFFTPREENKEKEKKNEKDDGKPDPTKKFLVPKGWVGWAAAVVGLPSSYREGSPGKPKPNKVGSMSPTDIEAVAVKTGDSPGKLSDGGGSELERRKKEELTESLLNMLLEFHVKGKEEEKRKNKEKKDDEKKMTELHLVFDLRFAVIIVIAYVLCVSCIFLA